MLAANNVTAPTNEVRTKDDDFMSPFPSLSSTAVPLKPRPRTPSSGIFWTT
jgi:hypothetical protein